MTKTRKNQHLLVLASFCLALFLQFYFELDYFFRDGAFSPLMVAVIISCMVFTISASRKTALAVLLCFQPPLHLYSLLRNLLRGTLHNFPPLPVVLYTVYLIFPLATIYLYRRFIQNKPADLMLERAPGQTKQKEKPPKEIPPLFPPQTPFMKKVIKLAYRTF